MIFISVLLLLLLQERSVGWYLSEHWCCCKIGVLGDIYQHTNVIAREVCWVNLGDIYHCTNVVVACIICCVIFTNAPMLLQGSCVV